MPVNAASLRHLDSGVVSVLTLDERVHWCWDRAANTVSRVQSEVVSSRVTRGQHATRVQPCVGAKYLMVQGLDRTGCCCSVAAVVLIAYNGCLGWTTT